MLHEMIHEWLIHEWLIHSLNAGCFFASEWITSPLGQGASSGDFGCRWVLGLAPLPTNEGNSLVGRNAKDQKRPFFSLMNGYNML